MLSSKRNSNISNVSNSNAESSNIMILSARNNSNSKPNLSANLQRDMNVATMKDQLQLEMK